MKNTFILVLISIFLILCSAVEVKATHLRASDITLEKDPSGSSLTYLIRLNIFQNTNPDEIREDLTQENANDVLNFVKNELRVRSDIATSIGTNEGIENVSRGIQAIDDNVVKIIFTYRYTFPRRTGFIISYTGINRNEGIINIPGILVPLYVETSIFLPTDADNETPKFINDPLVFAIKDQIYTYNPGAFDPDGDQLVFELITPNSGFSTNNPFGTDVLNFPSYESQNFSIDPVTGTITWDRPTGNADDEYNIAFVVREFRDGAQIGYVVRDVQIIIKEGNNKPPLLFVPKDTCIVVGQALIDTIYARDTVVSSNINLRITSNAQTALGTASFTSTQNSTVDSATGIFEWTPSCDFARQEPIILSFRAFDNPPTGEISASVFDTWSITVKAPAPTGLQATRNSGNDTIALSWDDYSLVCDNADKINIWRISCREPDTVNNACILSSPSDLGYEFIGSVNGTETTFPDTTASKGITYYYAITADLLRPSNGNSILSDTASAILLLDIPTITKVDIIETDSVGTIDISWISPKSSTVSTPYDYDLYRIATTDFSKNPFDGDIIASLTGLTSLIDTNFQDTTVNTIDSAYIYGVRLTDFSSQEFDSESASSTFLNATSVNEGIILDWQNQVPWSNSTTLASIVFEDTTFVSTQVVPFDAIDTISAPLLTYDTRPDFRLPCDTFYYYVQTQGEFCSDLFQDTIINRTQIIMGIPDDTRAPDPISLINTSDTSECSGSSINLPLINSFEWFTPATPGEFITNRNDISVFNIYKKTEKSDTFTLVRVINFGVDSSHADTFLVEDRAAIYAITAVDEKGNESELTELSIDNCFTFELPNIFTPNGDGLNDTFIPKLERFISSFDIKIYNRWGALVFESDDSSIAWSAKNVSDGTYFYQYIVNFKGLNKSSERKKGYITIKR